MTRLGRAAISWQAMVVAAALALTAAALAYAWLAPASATSTPALRDVTTTIRCPTCIGESIADSTAPLSQAMRDEAERRLAAGESPDDVREFFAEAYGPDVLLAPPIAGPGVVVWAVPAGIALVAAVALTATVLARARRPAPRQQPRRFVWVMTGSAAMVLAVAAGAIAATGAGQRGSASPTASDGPAASHVEALAAAVSSAPADADLRLALATALASTGEHDRAEEHAAAAHRLRPTDPDVGYLHASVLLQKGEVQAAGDVLDEVLDVQPEHTSALLMRGVMLWRTGDARGADLLERYLVLSPEDPAADGVREMLAQDAPA